jgi:hypothetical protein
MLLKVQQILWKFQLFQKILLVSLINLLKTIPNWQNTIWSLYIFFGTCIFNQNICEATCNFFQFSSTLVTFLTNILIQNSANLEDIHKLRNALGGEEATAICYEPFWKPRNL